MKAKNVQEMPKWGALVFTGLFMTAFGAVAVTFGLLPISDAISTAWRANSLVEVAATIKEVRLERGTRVTQKHQRSLSARYSYQWRGVTYDSSRISIQHWAGWHDGAHWHQEWFDRLDQARKTGVTVPAWVNPIGQPNAVLDKEVRFARLFLAIPLLLLFGGVSAIAGYGFVRVLRGRSRAQ